MTDQMPDDITVNQLHALGYSGDVSVHSHNKPLLICDVDEVVLHLVDPFAQVLVERGYLLKSHSFKLTGNVYHADSGREASQDEVWAGLEQLFKEQATRQHVVDGAADALRSISNDVDVLFLTNLPHEFGDIRRTYLSEHGLNFPLITNTRSKVPAIRSILQHTNKPVGFIDDTPKNLDQVREGAPDVHLFHFMANEQFRGLAGEIEGIHFSTGDWAAARDGILSVLMENT